VTAGARNTPSSGERHAPSRWLTAAAFTAVVFFAGMVVGVAVLRALPWSGHLNLALFGVMIVALPWLPFWRADARKRLPKA